MTCDERREQFLLDAFGGLEPAESQALRAHLAKGCTSCAGASAEALAVATQFAMALPPVKPNPQVLDRLMDRVRAAGIPESMPINSLPIHAATTSGVKVKGDQRLVFGWVATLATAALAASLAAVITAGVMWSQLRDERLLKTPDLRYVALAGTNPQPKARGRIFWDADGGYWHVYIFDLAAPASGKTYELWFIGNDGRKTPAGLFESNNKGDANLVVKVPANLGSLAAAAVTDENAGGSPQPTGTIQLLGKIQ
jgi:anti-sigma-K factor RskA